MKKFKDFIYNTNDILVALLILVAAAGIIIWRMNVILDYPKEFLGTTEYTDDAVSDISTGSDTQDSDDVQMPSDVAAVEASENDDSENADSKDVSTAEENTVFSDDGTLQDTITVDIEGSSASAAVGCMVDSGLFTDYDEYAKLCEDNGLDPEKIAAGRFKFVAGSSKLDIVKQVNWG